MLRMLAESGWIDAATAEELTDAYWFLRDVEHRIQMVHDEQTHLLPETEPELNGSPICWASEIRLLFGCAVRACCAQSSGAMRSFFEQEAKLSTETGTWSSPVSRMIRIRSKPLKSSVSSGRPT